MRNGDNSERDQDAMDGALKFSKGFYLKQDSTKEDSKHNCTNLLLALLLELRNMFLCKALQLQFMMHKTIIQNDGITKN